MSAPKKLILIEYPGVVKNVDKMLQTLGGLDHLKKVFSNSSLRLQLKFRPNDPFAHCAIADKLQVNNLLVRTTRKRVHYSDGSSEIKYETTIVGVIEATYRFKTLADFQWLPLERTNFDAKQALEKLVTFDKSAPLNFDLNFDQNDVEMSEDDSVQGQRLDDRANEELEERSRQLLNDDDDRQPATYKSISKQVYPHNPLDGKVRKLDADAPLFIMPMIFSRFDTPSDYCYKLEPKTKRRSEEEEKRNKSVISFRRKSRSKYVYLVTFQDDPPRERLDQTDNNLDIQLLEKLKVDFEERPIWCKTELAYRHKLRRNDLKHYLPLIAYYYVNGPFRGQWVRFGFNPKEDSSSRFFQTLDLRTTNLLSKKSRTDEPGRGGPSTGGPVYNQVKSLTLEKKIREVKIAPNHLVTGDRAENDETMENDADQPEESSVDLDSTVSAVNKTLNSSSRKTYSEQVTDVATFKFLAGRIPKYKQIFYQLINIELDEVQQLVGEGAPTREACEEKDGWWPAGTIDKVRSLMISHVNSLLDGSSDMFSSVLGDNLDEVEEELMEYSSD